MKRLIVVAIAALSAPAMAADFLAQAPVTSWTGFYLGANAAYSIDKSSMPDPTSPVLNASGAFGGATIGGDYQMGRVVLGALADADFGRATTTQLNGTVMTETADMNLFATVRGRAGYLVLSDLLIFASGGLALASVDLTETCPSGAAFGFCAKHGPYSLTSTQTFIGGAVGGGAEWMVLGGFSVKAEYLASFFGNQTFALGTVVDQTLPASKQVAIPLPPHPLSLSSQQVRLGVNYRF